jgi:hypothetical protein
MENEQTTNLNKWYTLLAVAMSSVATMILAATTPYSYPGPVLALVLYFWIVLGFATGIWIIIGNGWKVYERDVRMRLALGFFTVTWGGSIVIFQSMPDARFLTLFAGLGLLILWLLALLESRRKRQHEHDLFP